eukprot:scaffold2519_cov168-Amphora_coffeaeformis.AAC.19
MNNNLPLESNTASRTLSRWEIRVGGAKRAPSALCLCPHWCGASQWFLQREKLWYYGIVVGCLIGSVVWYNNNTIE